MRLLKLGEKHEVLSLHSLTFLLLVLENGEDEQRTLLGPRAQKSEFLSRESKSESVLFAIVIGRPDALNRTGAFLFELWQVGDVAQLSRAGVRESARGQEARSSSSQRAAEEVEVEVPGHEPHHPHNPMEFLHQ